MRRIAVLVVFAVTAVSLGGTAVAASPDGGPDYTTVMTVEMQSVMIPEFVDVPFYGLMPADQVAWVSSGGVEEPVPWTPDLWAYLGLNRFEHAGVWHNEDGKDGTFRGGLQFYPDTWRRMGGSGDPAAASIAEQIYRGRLLQQCCGWGQWPRSSKAVGLR